MYTEGKGCAVVSDDGEGPGAIARSMSAGGVDGSEHLQKLHMK